MSNRRRCWLWHSPQMGTNALISHQPGNAAHPLRRSFWKAFALTYTCLLAMIAITAGTVGHSLREQLRRTLQNEITRSLTQKAQMLAYRIDADHANGIDVITSQEGQAAGARATVIDTNRKVIADSEILASSLQDEGRMPEFAAALRGSPGVEVRTRNGAQVLFVAVPVSGGAARLAYPLADIDAAIHDATSTLLIGCAFAAALGVVLAATFSLLVQTR